MTTLPTPDPLPLVQWQISAERGSGEVQIGGATLGLVAAHALAQRFLDAIAVASGIDSLTATLIAEVDAQWQDCSAVRYRCDGKTAIGVLQRFKEHKRTRAMLRISPLQTARLMPNGRRWHGMVETISVVQAGVIRGPDGPIATDRRVLWTPTGTWVSVASEDVLAAVLTEGVGRRVKGLVQSGGLA